MAIYPPGVNLAQLSIGPVTDMFGDTATLTVQVTPKFTNGVSHITHVSGHSVVATTKSFISDAETGIVTFAVPYTDQPGWQDPSGQMIDVSEKPGWAYDVVVSATVGRAAAGKWTKTVQPLSAQTGEIDIDLVSSGPALDGVLAPQAAVLSVAGLTGHVTRQQLINLGLGGGDGTGGGGGGTYNLQIGTVVSGSTPTASISTDVNGNNFLNLTLVKGDKGADGKGVSSITDADGNGIATITYTDGSTASISLPPGQKGDSGPAGVITSVTATGIANGLQPTVDLTGTPEARSIALGIPAGAPGATGRSAYQVWLDQGNTGTVSDYLEALRGPQGLTGDQGSEGPMGSGLEITGSVATRPDLDTLNPAPVKDDAYVALDTGLLYIYDGTTWSTGIPFKGEPGQDGADGLPGADGQSAYELWLDLGNIGTEQQFLDSLRGTDGRGVTSIVANGDGTATITYTDTTTAQITLPEGQKGDPGIDGTDGSTGSDGRGVTSIVANGDGTATITYTDATTAQLTLPQGDPGPSNTLAIGTVSSGASASASITGTSPNQTLDLVLPVPPETAKTNQAQTWTTVQTFDGGPDGPAIDTRHITVRPRFAGGSASMFLDNSKGQTWEFFANYAGAFGVYNISATSQPLTINTDAPENALTLGGILTLGVPLAMGDRMISGVAAPTADDHAVNRGYVDTGLNSKADSAEAVPAGGSAGQILAKNSSTNNDVVWINPPTGGGSTATANTPFLVRYVSGAWEFASLAAAQTAGLNTAQTIWFLGPIGVATPTWARTGDIWMEA